MAKTTNTKKASSKSAMEQPTTTESKLMELFTDGIKDIYWAEKKLTTTLPKMQKAATAPQLAAAIEEHIEVTKNQVTRLEQVFELLGKTPQAKKCDAMEGLAKEGDSILEETDKGSSTRDVGIILASQKVEHYEIATYSGLAQLATTLGLSDIADLLTQTLEEEKEADATLSAIAETGINYEAAVAEM